MAAEAVLSNSQSSDQWYESDDSAFLEALRDSVFPGDIEYEEPEKPVEPPPHTQPSLKRRYEKVQEISKDDEVYGEAHFGEFGEYMGRKRAKLQIQNQSILTGSSTSGIFKNIAIYVNGFTIPSIQELRELVIKHGGVFQAYLDKKSIVTHIITCSLTPAKQKEFQNMKVVKPEWLVQSAEQGVLLPWQDFIFQPAARSELAQGAKPSQKTLDNLLRSSDTKTSRETAVDPVFTSGYAADDSNPNAQRAMANDDWRKAHTSANPDFIEGYYKNSRLHHLATWKAELRSLVQEAQDRADRGVEGKVAADTNLSAAGVSMRGAEFVMRSPGKDKGKEKSVPLERIIMHCDFDCFFVSAGLVKYPELRGKPAVVCHSQGGQGGASSTSEIASASYEARAFGIKNGMSLQQARKLCPEIVTIPYEFELYKELSLKFYIILMSYSDDLQAVSVDEALIDVSKTVQRLRQKSKSLDPAKEFAESLRREVKAATGCEVSIGIAHNILLARLATRKAKPAGSFHVRPDDIHGILMPLDISDLHGFGWAAKQKAQDKLGTTKLEGLVKKSKAALCDALGKHMGETLYKNIRGIDDRKLESDKARKSVSCEINYGIRFQNNTEAEAFIRQMAVEVSKRLKDIKMVGKSITLKIMKRDPTAPIEPPKFMGHGACETFSKQSILVEYGGRATADDGAIGDQAWVLLKAFNFDPKELRGIGIQIQKLESPSLAAGGVQKKLPFGRFPVKTKPLPPPPEQPRKQSSMPPPTAVPRKPSDPLDLPSLSQVDKSVFNALPEDIKKELEKEYRRRSASPALPGPSDLTQAHQTSGQSAVSDLFLKYKPKFKKAPTGLFPPTPAAVNVPVQKTLGPRRPRFNVPFRPQKTWNSLMKYRGTKSMQLTNEDFRKLGIDQNILMALPRAIRNEQIARARLIKNLGAVPEVPDVRYIIKRPLPSPKYYPRLPNPKAKYLQPALLRQQGKGEKLYFHETDDIQNVVEAWVKGYERFPPNNKDVEFFSKYLCQSVDSKLCSDEGVQRALAICKWWLLLLRRRWRKYETMKETEENEEADREQKVGMAWWKAFRQVKGQMDEIARKKFGGKLSLR